MIGTVENKSVWFLLLAFFIGWFIAQFTKLIIGWINKGKLLSLKEIIYFFGKSGGMPSGHTASFVALTTTIGLMYGYDQPVFALSVCTTIIFIYDAINVRYAVGEHGKLLNEIAETDGNPLTKPQKIVEGHTVPQVIVGAMVGVVVGVLVFMLAGGRF